MAGIDLNCDLGEGYLGASLPVDRAMLAIVSSANVATGGHSGDVETMRAVCLEAVGRGVAVGAHVSYRDPEQFGRRMRSPASAELQAELEAQIELLAGIAAHAGTRVAYVKPHGALYNTIAHDERQARDVIAAMRAVGGGLALLGLAGSRGLELAAEAGLPTVAEAFADRGYTDAGALVPRGEPGALLHDPDAVAERMLRLVETGRIESSGGRAVRIDAESICVHSDTPGAVEMARRVRERLAGSGIEVRPFAADPAG